MATKNTGLGSDPFDWIRTTDTKGNTSNQEMDIKETKEKQKDLMVDGKKIRVIPIHCIAPDPKQPRKGIVPDSEDILELAESIKKHGFINFITVKGIEPDKYVIVAGERRFTAAKVAGLQEIPVMVIAEDKEPVDYALIQLEENLQRKDLTPFEEAETYTRLQQEFGLQQKQIVERTRKSKGYISRMMKLSEISREIKDGICAKNPPREVLFELASFAPDQQKTLWEKIQDNPTIVAFERARKRLETQTKPQEQEKMKTPDPDTVWEALRKAMKKDKNMLFEFIPPKKVERLLKEYGDSDDSDF